jgi:hypothetical protein
MTGWAVNSIALAVEGSIPFLPNLNMYIASLYSSMVERDTVNILIDVRFTLEAVYYSGKTLYKLYFVLLIRVVV